MALMSHIIPITPSDVNRHNDTSHFRDSAKHKYGKVLRAPAPENPGNGRRSDRGNGRQAAHLSDESTAAVKAAIDPAAVGRHPYFRRSDQYLILI